MMYSLLLTLLPSAALCTVIGYIEKESANEFLTCTDSSCSWEGTPTQRFELAAGKDGQNRFRYITDDGVDTGKCLDREHCHEGSSNARLSDCNHCGSYHWTHIGWKLGEDHMKNCIQYDGNIKHCSSAQRRYQCSNSIFSHLIF